MGKREGDRILILYSAVPCSAEYESFDHFGTVSAQIILGPYSTTEDMNSEEQNSIHIYSLHGDASQNYTSKINC
jgi:hypothetical protein